MPQNGAIRQCGLRRRRANMLRVRAEFPLSAGWAELVRACGLSPEDVLREAQLPRTLLVKSEIRLEPEAYFRFWATCERLANDPAMPIRAGTLITTSTFSPPLFAALCSPNLHVAYSRIATYKRLVCPMVLRVELTEVLTVHVDWSFPPRQLPSAMVATELVFLTELGRRGSGEPMQPLAVVSPRPLEPLGLYQDYFGVTPEPGPHPAMVFSRDDALTPFATCNEAMWEVFEPELRRRLAALDAAASAREQVRAALLELLPTGGTSVEEVARKLAMSKRTLQRRLKQEGTSFQTVLDGTREELARHYLLNTSMACAEISFLLGFGDPSSFFRAFHGWTGTSPERVRRQVRAPV